MTKVTLAFAVFAVLGAASISRADVISMSDRRSPEERAEASRLRREARDKDRRETKAAEEKVEADRVAALQVQFDADQQKREARDAEETRRKRLEYGALAAVLGMIGAAGFYKAKR